MNITKKLFLGLAVLLTSVPAFANPLVDEVVENSRLRFMEASQLGYSWNLSNEESGPIALLDLYQYRFIILGAGWTSPFPSEKKGAIVGTVGVHLDKLTRLIAPNASNIVRSVVPAVVRPAWDRLTLSYGPGYNFDTERFTHLISVNFQFGE